MTPSAQLSLPHTLVNRERAEELCQHIPIDSTLVLRHVRCSKVCCVERDARGKARARKGVRGHGPYWFAYVERRRIYLGNDDKRDELVAAWDMLRAEHAPRLEAAREAKLERMRARAAGARLWNAAHRAAAAAAAPTSKGGAKQARR